MSTVIYDFVPSDHSRQVNLDYYIGKLLMEGRLNNEVQVLDLGCGIGESQKNFKKINSQIHWVGLDIEDSPEVNSRIETNFEFKTFDGINIPFPDNHFNIVYSKQVFEHVRYPRELLVEVKRVLKPDGYFIGSTSHLEPFHSLSYWNYTPFGFSQLVEEAGLKISEIRPGIDALTLIIRRGLGSPKFFNIFFRKESPLNVIISIVGKIIKLPISNINTIKLLFCGHFVFLVNNRIK